MHHLVPLLLWFVLWQIGSCHVSKTLGCLQNTKTYFNDLSNCAKMKQHSHNCYQIATFMGSAQRHGIEPNLDSIRPRLEPNRSKFHLGFKMLYARSRIPTIPFLARHPKAQAWFGYTHLSQTLAFIFEGSGLWGLSLRRTIEPKWEAKSTH